MNPQQEELIRSLVLQKRSREDIKHEVISQGFSSKGFEESYVKMLNETHMEEPKTATTTTAEKLEAMGFTSDAPSSLKGKSTRSHFFPVIIVVCVLFIGVYLFLVYGMHFSFDLSHRNGGANGQDDMSVADSVLRSKVDVTAESAQYYDHTMGSYDGVCTGIAVVNPIKCSATAENYSIFTVLSTGDVYCTDSSGFKGILDHLSDGNGLCK